MSMDNQVTLHKADALAALLEVYTLLRDEEQQITRHVRAKLAASVRYVTVEVEAIEELKRARRAAKPAPGGLA